MNEINFDSDISILENTKIEIDKELLQLRLELPSGRTITSEWMNRAAFENDKSSITLQWAATIQKQHKADQERPAKAKKEIVNESVEKTYKECKDPEGFMEEQLERAQEQIERLDFQMKAINSELTEWIQKRDKWEKAIKAIAPKGESNE